MSETSSNDKVKYENFFTIAKSRIAQMEYIRIAKLGGLFLLFLLAVIFLILPTYKLTLYTFALCLLVIIEILSIPVQLIRILYNSHRCPFEITLSNEGITFDQLLITTTNIKSITLTDKNVVSKSVYPKYRYLRVKTAEKKHVFWLGSESGFSYHEYEEFTDNIVKFCTIHSIPVYFKKK